MFAPAIVLACVSVASFGQEIGDALLLLQTRAGVREGAGNAGAAVQAKLQCRDEVTGPFWGIWIDGRSASEGPNVYSEHYTTAMRATTAAVYEMAREQQPELKFDVYMRIRESMGKFWSVHWSNHIQLMEDHRSSNIRKCWMRQLPKKYVASILEDIVLYDMDEVFALRPSQKFNLTHKPNTIQALFNTYNGKIADAATADQKIAALGWLLRNMAYLHPLVDGNGRTRTMLLQHELRRLGLACGSMMYNNNLNIYVDNLHTYLEKVREGIKMYETAERTSTNPWQIDFALHDKAHRDRFRTEFTDTMQACTARECGAQDVDSYGANCQGGSNL